MKRFVLSFLVMMVTLAGCTANNSGGMPLSDMTFKHLGPMPLRVSEVIKREAVGQKRMITEDFSVPVDELLESYIADRLKPVGGPETLFVELEELTVTHSVKDPESKVAGFMGVAKVDSYAVSASFNLALENPSNGALRGKRFKVSRIINVSEHVSVIERETRQQEGIEAMFKDIDLMMMQILKNEFML
jgi:hypothetical protein